MYIVYLEAFDRGSTCALQPNITILSLSLCVGSLKHMMLGHVYIYFYLAFNYTGVI